MAQTANSQVGKEVILSEYVLDALSPIAKSYHGQVFPVRRITNDQLYVVKMEDTTRYQLLENEFKILKLLDGFRGIPKVIQYAHEESKARNLMILEMLGQNLDTIFKQCTHKFSNKCIVQLALQMFNIVEHIHSRGYVHGDIIPENFCVAHPHQPMSLPESYNDGFGHYLIYLVDYGLSSPYKDTHGVHVKDEGKGPKRTTLPRYMSRNVHKGKIPTRRDDLESLGYIWAYWVSGDKGLKWQNLNKPIEPKTSVISIAETPVSNNESPTSSPSPSSSPSKTGQSLAQGSKNILRVKETISASVLFQTLPKFADYMTYVLNLKVSLVIIDSIN